MMKLVILERESLGLDVGIECLEELGELTVYALADQEATPARIADADVVLCNKTRLTERELGAAPHLKLIAEMATGYDNIDLAYCREHGIAVANAGHYSTTAVVQHTFALALALLGKIPHYDQVVKSGAYGAQDNFAIFDEPVVELAGKTWGIVGFGNIGRAVARVAEAFGCQVITASPTGRDHSGEAECVGMEELLARSDILSLHCPLTERTANVFNHSAFARMKDSAILINVARGGIVDARALYDALMDGEIAGAGLDVLDEEPIRPENPLSLITDSSRLIITPHMAWASVEARTRDIEITAENIRSFLRGEKKNRIV